MADEALTTLLNMGFGYEESTAALETCKKDVSEAVAYLTDPTRAIVPFGPQQENKDSQPMDVETFEIPEEFPSQGLLFSDFNSTVIPRYTRPRYIPLYRSVYRLLYLPLKCLFSVKC